MEWSWCGNWPSQQGEMEAGGGAGSFVVFRWLGKVHTVQLQVDWETCREVPTKVPGKELASVTNSPALFPVQIQTIASASVASAPAVAPSTIHGVKFSEEPASSSKQKAERSCELFSPSVPERKCCENAAKPLLKGCERYKAFEHHADSECREHAKIPRSKRAKSIVISLSRQSVESRERSRGTEVATESSCSYRGHDDCVTRHGGLRELSSAFEQRVQQEEKRVWHHMGELREPDGEEMECPSALGLPVFQEAPAAAGACLEISAQQEQAACERNAVEGSSLGEGGFQVGTWGSALLKLSRYWRGEGCDLGGDLFSPFDGGGSLIPLSLLLLH